MRRGRGRAAGFAAAAAVCAGLAAAATQAPSGDLAAQGGELRDVLVAARPLQRHRTLRPTELADAVDIRRLPERFIPPDALASPHQAVGRRLPVSNPAGSYLLASEFASPARHPDPGPQAADPGHRPVEITVAGAGALADGGTGSRRVDVVVTTESAPGGGPGKTYVAAPRVELLGLRVPDDATADPATAAAGDTWIATLALTRPQALRLIQAESFARAVRLIQR